MSVVGLGFHNNDIFIININVLGAVALIPGSNYVSGFKEAYRIQRTTELIGPVQS